MYPLFMLDRSPPKHTAGDTVWITYEPVSMEGSPYPAEIISVLTDEDTKMNGVHYVLVVRTHVDDYVDLRSATRVWESEEAFFAARDQMRARIKALQDHNKQMTKDISEYVVKLRGSK